MDKADMEVVVQSLSRVQLFATPWTAARQAPPSSTISQSLLRFMSYVYTIFGGCPGGSEGTVSACNAGDLGSIPGWGRSPGEGKWQPTPEFWPGEFHGLYSPWSHKESGTNEGLSLSHSPLANYGHYKVLVTLSSLHTGISSTHHCHVGGRMGVSE